MVGGLLLASVVGWTAILPPQAIGNPSDTLDVSSIAADSARATNSYVGEDLLDELLDAAETDVDGDAFPNDVASASHELLQELSTWKLDINRADREALESLPGMTPQDAARIVAYRGKRQRFRRIDQLLDAGVAPEIIRDIRPFLTIEESRRLPIRAEVVQRWSRRLTRQVGYDRDTTQSRYLGSPDGLMTRLRIETGRRIGVGLTLDKDPGEPLIDGGKRYDLGHDFTAGYLALRDLGPFEQILIGDYAVNVGEGLAFGQNGSIGSGPRSFRIRDRLRPHTSSREYGYFRGAGIAMQPLFGFRAGGFFSRRRIDARYDAQEGVWRFASTGLHRTPSERSRRDSGLESAIGWLLGYRRSGLHLELVGARTTRSVAGNTVAGGLNYSGYLSWTGSKLGFTLESARRGHNIALASALGFEPVRSVYGWMEVLRSPRGGFSPHSTTAVDAQGLSRTETRWHAGVRVRLSEKLTGTLTARWRRRPKHLMEGPSTSVSMLLAAKPSPWLMLRIRALETREEPLSSCDTGERLFRCATITHRRSLRIQLDYDHSRTLRHRFQVEASQGSTQTGVLRRGILLYKDVRWSVSPHLRIDGRVLFFEVADFVARIYAYENDLLYSFSAPVFSGRGRRAYVLLRLAPRRNLTVQAKYSTSIYEDEIGVGSGLDATYEPHRRDLRIQIRWKFGTH